MILLSAQHKCKITAADLGKYRLNFVEFWRFLALTDLIENDIRSTTILVQQAAQVKRRVDNLSIDNVTYYYLHLIDLVEKMIYDKQMLVGTSGRILAQPVRLNLSHTDYYIPQNFYPTRQFSNMCENEISFPENVSTYDKLRAIRNLTSLLHAIEKYPFSTELWKLHKNLKIFHICSSNYSMFLNEVKSLLVQISASPNGPGQNFIFEDVASPLLADSDWYMSNILGPYQANEVTKLQLGSRLSFNKISDIVSNAESVRASIVSKYSDYMRPIVSSFQTGFGIVYKNILQKLATFQLHFPEQHDVFRDRAKQMVVWQIPGVTLEAADILSFRISENETWRTWPDYMDIQYFVDNQFNNVLKDIDVWLFDIMEDKLASIDQTLQGYISRINTQMDDFRTDLDKLETESIVNDGFVL